MKWYNLLHVRFERRSVISAVKSFVINWDLFGYSGHSIPSEDRRAPAASYHSQTLCGIRSSPSRFLSQVVGDLNAPRQSRTVLYFLRSLQVKLFKSLYNSDYELLNKIS